MKYRPILFGAPMVRALLAGKTQTRRIIKGDVTQYAGAWQASAEATGGLVVTGKPCPYGQPGDRLWVRETWAHDAESLEQCRAAHEDSMGGLGHGPYYRATETAPDTLHWRPSIFMPRWASRITLEIVAVRVEHLKDISEVDALAEGIAVKGNGRYHCGFDEDGEIECRSPVTAYAWLWNSINGPDSWASNPWVWAIEFKRVPA